MGVIVFDGKRFAAEREVLLRKRIAKLGFRPKLASIFFREDPASVLYTKLKGQTAKRIGIDFHGQEVSLAAPVEDVLATIRNLSGEPKVHGILIQKPAAEIASPRSEEVLSGGGTIETVVLNLTHSLKAGLAAGSEEWWRRLTAEISPQKDVDCLTTASLDLVYRGRWKIIPATVRAVLFILEKAEIPLINRQAVVVGRSEIVGKPLAHVLAQRGSTVTLCASTGVVAKSRGDQLIEAHEPLELIEATREADVLVSAAGQPGIITGGMVKKGAVVIDVGAPEGDVEFDSVARKASFITPVPGGVGPVTVVSLL